MIPKTEKLYYRDTLLTSCTSTITDVSTEGVALDRTVAFPEGGGQQGDHGGFKLPVGSPEGSIPFTDTQKGLGRMVYLDDFPTIQVDTPVYHKVDPALLQHFTVGMVVMQEIDRSRRAKLTVSHTAIHLALMGLEQVRPGITRKIKGCSITEDSSRLDFSVQERFTAEEIIAAQAYADAIIKADERITVFPHPKEPEAWFWKCRDFTIPCGGTHLPSAKYIASVKLKRDTRGKGTERLIARFPDAQPPFELYHV